MHRLPLREQHVDIRTLAPAAARDPAGEPEGEVAVALGGEGRAHVLMRLPAGIGHELGEGGEPGIIRPHLADRDQGLGGEHVEIARRPERSQQPPQLGAPAAASVRRDRGLEQGQRRAQAAQRHPDLVQALRVARDAGRGLIVEPVPHARAEDGLQRVLDRPGLQPHRPRLTPSGRLAGREAIAPCRLVLRLEAHRHQLPDRLRQLEQ